MARKNNSPKALANSRLGKVRRSRKPDYSANELLF
jgi:hypothetical protein